jgi:hypothetical protein
MTLSGFVAAAGGEADRVLRPMIIHRVAELGLEIWTEKDPEWEARLVTREGMRPTFVAESPFNSYPPAGMSWACPGIKFTEAEFERSARSAVSQAASNYSLAADVIERIVMTPATYGELRGFQADFSAFVQGLPVDVRVFFGHVPGKPAVAMQVFAQAGKLASLNEQIRRSWGNVRYLD